MKMTEAQQKSLIWLSENGGSGILDRYNRVCAKGMVRGQGAWSSWLRLVAMGYIAGDDGRFTITSAGYDALAERKSDEQDT